MKFFSPGNVDVLHLDLDGSVLTEDEIDCVSGSKGSPGKGCTSWSGCYADQGPICTANQCIGNQAPY